MEIWRFEKWVALSEKKPPLPQGYEVEKVENFKIFKWKENIFLQSLQGMVNDATYSNQTESGRNWQELDDDFESERG